MLNLASVTWHLQLFGDNGEGYVLTRFDDRSSVARTSHVSDGRKLPGALGQQVEQPLLSGSASPGSTPGFM